MAAVTVKDQAKSTLTTDELAEIYRKCEDLLPLYAWPRFLRLQKSLEVTSTFKQQKFKLVKEGFDPSQSNGEALYCLSTREKKYIELDQAIYKRVLSLDIRM